MRIAIIGSGISGLGAAFLLKEQHNITLYEKNNYAGGHSRTINVDLGDHSVPVDTGFIVFNNWNYPNLFGLFDVLEVPYHKSDMSFGVSVGDGWLEYSSNGLFAQSKNIIRPRYYGMLADVLKFNKQAFAYIEKDADITLGECLDQLSMGEWFKRYYLLAMGAAIWSCPTSTIMNFPARTFLRFFKNHGLLSVNNRPQWYSVKGGSQEYVSRLIKALNGDVRLECGVKKVIRLSDGHKVIDQNGLEEIFDQIIFACHANEAIALLDDPEPYQGVIGEFDYQENNIVVHRDKSFMPKNKGCWASWVYLSEVQVDKKSTVSLSYWMNNLQELDTDQDIFVTLNAGRRPQEDLIIDEHVFFHPIFDLKAIKAQERIKDVQGKNGVWFCGAYQRYGFHEDGLLSAVNVAKTIGVDIPWE